MPIVHTKMSDKDYVEQLRAHADEGGTIGEPAAKSILEICERLLARIHPTLAVQMGECITPDGLRARAEIVRPLLNDSGSCARHLELAAAEIARLSV